MHRKICRFTGHVQGVGFRCTVKNIALQYDVHGYIRNLPDGRVELVMEGPDQEMDGVLQNVNQRMEDFIRGVDQDVANATGEFNQFSIRH